MLAASRFATRHRPLSVLHGHRIPYNPYLSRSITGGPKSTNGGGEPDNAGASTTRSETDAAARQRESDKLVKEYLDSIKPSPNPPTPESAAPQKSLAAPTTTALQSNSASTKQPPALADQLSTEAQKASQSLLMWKDAALSLLRSRAQKAGAEAAVQFSELGGKLNKVTGYDEIEALKRRVVEREQAIAALRTAARQAKEAYSTAVSTRASRQREVNDLLQRKSSWSDADVLAFTKLVREDHLSAAAEAQAKISLEQAEAAVDAEFGALMRAILDRYHEEQVWSDKIRSVSTYGSLAALVVNILVFILAIVLVEPWKRRRLAQTFERRITEMSEETRQLVEGGMKGLEEHFEKQESFLAQLAGVTREWSTYVPVDHERPPVPEPTPIIEGPTEPSSIPSLPPLTQDTIIGQAKMLIDSLIPSTSRDYSLMALGGIGGLIGSGVVLLFRSSSQ